MPQATQRYQNLANDLEFHEYGVSDLAIHAPQFGGFEQVLQ